MIGAILGDMIGAPYEFDRGDKTKDFPLFSEGSVYTDDSVMTIAVAEALMDSMGKSDEEIKKALVLSMQKWGRKYPDAGYGEMFRKWLKSNNPEPYGSFGNGSAMRVSSAGWLFDTLEETRHIARLTAEVTHNHPEGIKGAEAAASAIYLARNEFTKDSIREYIENEFGYDLSRTCDEIRPGYHHVETCQETVPEAITAFLEGEDFEDVIRTAVSLGGDCDTLTCIAGGIAEAFYEVPQEMYSYAIRMMDEDMRAVVQRFYDIIDDLYETDDPSLAGNKMIEIAITKAKGNLTAESMLSVMDMISERMYREGHFLFPVQRDENNNVIFKCIKADNGKVMMLVYTSYEEAEKGETSEVISDDIESILKSCLASGADGILINPWGDRFLLTDNMIEMILGKSDTEEDESSDPPLTPELLEDGSYLKQAIETCLRDLNIPNIEKVLTILRDSHVWVPCNAIIGEADQTAMEKAVNEAEEKGNIESLIGQTFSTKEEIRMVPDILKSEEDFLFPVFTSAEEMGEYGEHFSKVQMHFLKAIDMAASHEKDLRGIVINAYSTPFVVEKKLFEEIRRLESAIEKRWN